MTSSICIQTLLRTMLPLSRLPSCIKLIASAVAAAVGCAGQTPSLNLLSDTIVTSTGFNFATGEFGTSINGQTFQQKAVVTFNGYQYAAYWESGARPAIARRALPDGAWQSIVFTDYTVVYSFANNTHNVATVGISADDGTIHFSFDQHNTPLRIRRSAPGAATNPTTVAWNASLFSATSDALIPGQKISSVTYPTFFSTPQGKLQFCYRSGQSGNGDWHLWEYSAGTWQRVGMLFGRTGTYGSHTTRCAYPNLFRYGDNGRLHITWTWRESGTTLKGNHDICYAYSDDYGRTWKNNSGVAIAALDGTADPANAISINSPGHVAYSTPFNWGMQNQGTQFVDDKNRVHTVIWRNPGTASSGTLDKNNWRYFHYWRDTSGVWHEQILPFWGRKPQVVFDDEGSMHVIYGAGANLNYGGSHGDPGTELTIATATEAGGWMDWQVRTPIPGRIYHGEPLTDATRWKDQRILSIYFQEKPAIAGNPSPLHVMDFQPSGTSGGGGGNELFADDFSDGDADGWTVTPAAKWSIVNVAGNPACKFTYDWSNTTGTAHAGQSSWANYTVALRMNINSAASWGQTRIDARYVDDDNLYSLVLSEEGGPTNRRFIIKKRLNGITSNLASTAWLPVQADTWYAVEFTVDGGLLTARLDGVEILQTTDTSIPAGSIRIGGYTQVVLFDDIEVVAVDAAHFAEDFSDGDAGGWAASSAPHWSVINDAGNPAYQFTFDWNNTSGISTAGELSWADYVVGSQVKVTVLNNWSETRLFGRYVDANNHYYVALVQESGDTQRRVQIKRRFNGATTNLASSAWMTLNLGTWNLLEFELIGTELRAYVNGVQAAHATDSSISAGKIGVGGYKQNILFDDIMVVP